jgi:calcium/calmodulin-dependent protein kinase I
LALTPPPPPPQVVDLMYGGEGYGRPSDLWSFGVLTYLVLCGKLPYDHQEVDDPVPDFDLEALMGGTGAAEAGSDQWGGVSSLAKEVVEMALDRDPQSRVTAEDLLEHAWFAEVSWDSATMPGLFAAS